MISSASIYRRKERGKGIRINEEFEKNKKGPCLIQPTNIILNNFIILWKVIHVDQKGVIHCR